MCGGAWLRTAGVKVLLTGDRGYIGAVLAPVLRGAGHDVVGLDADYYAGCDLEPWPPEARSIRADIRDVVSADLTGFDAVVHLAALSNDPIGDLDPRVTYAINRDATVGLARAAREAGVRKFVFASSCSMYGASGTDELLDEDSPLRPLTPYAESKVRAEEALWDLEDGEFCPVSMRNATVYGSSPRLRLDVVLNNLAAWAYTTRRVRLLSDGTAWRPLVHVEDLARVTAAILVAPEGAVRGQALNIGTNVQNYRIQDLADLIARESGCAVEFGDDATPDPRSYRVDFTKLESVIPSTSFTWDATGGVRELLVTYERIGLSRELFESSRFVRLRRIRELRDEGALTEDLRWGAVEDPAALSE
jgi:nucleoside-diphosphate-sugar epimerase